MKTTKMVDNQNWRKREMDDDQKWKTLKTECNKNGRQPKWNTTRMEDEQSDRLLPNIAVRLQQPIS